MEETLNQDERRIVHLHIPKTAGTALKSAFSVYGKGKMRIFPHYDERRCAEVSPQDYDFYSGHFGFKTAKRLDGDMITVFRNPVDRFLSVYYFWRQLYETGAEVSNNTTLAHKYSIDEFVKIRDQYGLIEEFFNRMTWQIAYGSSAALRLELRLAGYSEDEIYRMATQNLSAFSVIGVQDRMDAFTSEMSRKYGILLDLKNINSTRNRSFAQDIRISTLNEIHNWVYMDIELYHHVLSRFNQRPSDRHDDLRDQNAAARG